MNIVDLVRKALLKVLRIEKVYLLYMDEIKHVHWHLVPRFNEKGLNVFLLNPKKIKAFSIANHLAAVFKDLRAYPLSRFRWIFS